MKHKICQKFLKISVFKTYYHTPLSQQQYTRRNLHNDNQAGARTTSKPSKRSQLDLDSVIHKKVTKVIIRSR